jgi:hypothetical protein
VVSFCLQGLVKFAVGFAVPYGTRIARIIIVALAVLLYLTDMQR